MKPIHRLITRTSAIVLTSAFLFVSLEPRADESVPLLPAPEKRLLLPAPAAPAQAAPAQPAALAEPAANAPIIPPAGEPAAPAAAPAQAAPVAQAPAQAPAAAPKTPAIVQPESPIIAQPVKPNPGTTTSNPGTTTTSTSSSEQTANTPTKEEKKLDHAGKTAPISAKQCEIDWKKFRHRAPEGYSYLTGKPVTPIAKALAPVAKAVTPEAENLRDAALATYMRFKPYKKVFADETGTLKDADAYGRSFYKDRIKKNDPPTAQTAGNVQAHMNLVESYSKHVEKLLDEEVVINEQVPVLEAKLKEFTQLRRKNPDSMSSFTVTLKDAHGKEYPKSFSYPQDMEAYLQSLKNKLGILKGDGPGSYHYLARTQALSLQALQRYRNALIDAAHHNPAEPPSQALLDALKKIEVVTGKDGKIPEQYRPPTAAFQWIQWHRLYKTDQNFANTIEQYLSDVGLAPPPNKAPKLGKIFGDSGKGGGGNKGNSGGGIINNGGINNGGGGKIIPLDDDTGGNLAGQFNSGNANDNGDIPVRPAVGKGKNSAQNSDGGGDGGDINDNGNSGNQGNRPNIIQGSGGGGAGSGDNDIVAQTWGALTADQKSFLGRLLPSFENGIMTFKNGTWAGGIFLGSLQIAGNGWVAFSNHQLPAFALNMLFKLDWTKRKQVENAPDINTFHTLLNQYIQEKYGANNLTVVDANGNTVYAPKVAADIETLSKTYAASQASTNRANIQTARTNSLADTSIPNTADYNSSIEHTKDPVAFQGHVNDLMVFQYQQDFSPAAKAELTAVLTETDATKKAADIAKYTSDFPKQEAFIVPIINARQTWLNPPKPGAPGATGSTGGTGGGGGIKPIIPIVQSVKPAPLIPGAAPAKANAGPLPVIHGTE